MASIRKRGNAWEVRIRKRGWPLTCKSFPTKVLAAQWARQIESEMDRGIFISRTEAETTTLHQALDRYMVDYIPRLSDSKRETNRAQAIQRHPFSNKFMAAIRTKDIAEFIATRSEEGAGPNTIRLDLALLSRLFEVAASDWGMESLSNPVRRASKPKLPGGRTRRLSKDEEKRLLEVAKKPFDDVIRFALETAMRREEIATMEWTNVDLRHGTVHLPKTKNGSPRSVPLSPTAIQILKNSPRRIHGTVFGMNKDAISRAMTATRRKAGIKDLCFHDLRHEATSRFFEKTDLDMMEISAITGHKSLQMLTRYTHLRAHKLAERLKGKKRENST
ncbi:MAG: site-specific integrase [Pseudodesulfovibrio sp.]|uniref:site-specific integrase n=1 Tax=Pseudodesulfovibrio sp. TaxID=2035812 RepID=UPI003D0FDE57